MISHSQARGSASKRRARSAYRFFLVALVVCSPISIGDASAWLPVASPMATCRATDHGHSEEGGRSRCCKSLI
jgi:hypothetical protein